MDTRMETANVWVSCAECRVIFSNSAGFLTSGMQGHGRPSSSALIFHFCGCPHTSPLLLCSVLRLGMSSVRWGLCQPPAFSSWPTSAFWRVQKWSQLDRFHAYLNRSCQGISVLGLTSLCPGESSFVSVYQGDE